MFEQISNKQKSFNQRILKEYAQLIGMNVFKTMIQRKIVEKLSYKNYQDYISKKKKNAVCKQICQQRRLFFNCYFFQYSCNFSVKFEKNQQLLTQKRRKTYIQIQNSQNTLVDQSQVKEIQTKVQMISVHITNKENNKKRSCSSGKKCPLSPACKKNQEIDLNDDILYLNYLSIFKIDRIPSNYVYIQELYLSHNMLRNLQGIEQFKNLRVLHLKFNFIAEFQEIDRIVNKFYLKSLNIKGNPIMKIEKNLMTFNYLKSNIFENLVLFNSDEPDPPQKENQQDSIKDRYDNKYQTLVNVYEKKKDQFKSQIQVRNQGDDQRVYSSQRHISQDHNDLLKLKCIPQKLSQKRHQSLLSTVSANQQFVERQINILNDAKAVLNKTSMCNQNIQKQKQDKVNKNKNEAFDKKITPLKRQASTNSIGSMSKVYNQMDASLHNKSSSRLINNFFDINDKINQNNPNFEEFEPKYNESFNYQQEDNNYIESEDNNNDILANYLQDSRKTNKNQRQNSQNQNQQHRNQNRYIPNDQYAEISELINSEREKSLENIRQLKKNVSQVQLDLSNLQKNLLLQNNIEQIVQNISSVQSQQQTNHKLTSNSLKSGSNQHISNIQNLIYLNGNLTNRQNRLQSSNNQYISQQSQINNNSNSIEVNSKENTQNKKNNYFQLLLNNQKQSRVSQQKHTFKSNKIQEKEYLDENIPIKFDKQGLKTANNSSSLLKQQRNTNEQFQNKKYSYEINPQVNHKIQEQQNDKIEIQQNENEYSQIEQVISSPVQNRRKIGFIKHISKDNLKYNLQQNNQQLGYDYQSQKNPRNISNNDQQKSIIEKSQNNQQKLSSIIHHATNNNNNNCLSDNRDYIKNKPLETSNIINNANKTEIINRQQQNNLQMINQHLYGKVIQKTQNQDFHDLYSNMIQEQCQTKRQINLQNIIQNNQGKENVIHHQSQSPRLLQSPKTQNQKQNFLQEQERMNDQLKSFIQKPQQKTLNQKMIQQIDKNNQQQYINNVQNQQKNIQQQLQSNSQTNILNGQKLNYLNNQQQNMSNNQQQKIQNYCSINKPNTNQIDFSNNYMVQSSIHKRGNSITGESIQRIVGSKSQYIQNKRNINEQHGFREYNSQTNNYQKNSVNNNNQNSYGISQNFSQNQIEQQSYQQNLAGNKSNSAISIIAKNDNNFQASQKQSQLTPLKLSYNINPLLNIQDNSMTPQMIHQYNGQNFQNQEINKLNLNLQNNFIKPINNSHNQDENEKKIQLSKKINSNTQSAYSSTQQSQTANIHINQDLLSQNLQSFGSNQPEIFEYSCATSLNRSNQKETRQEYVNDQQTQLKKEHMFSNDGNLFNKERNILGSDGLQFANCGLQQSLNSTITSNLADQLQLTMNSLDKQNQIRNNMNQLISNSKSMVNLRQNNFMLRSSGSVGELMNTELQSPSSTLNQVIHVNQLLSSAKNQNCGNNQFNPNQLYVFGSDFKNSTINYQNLSSQYRLSPDINTSKFQASQNIDKNLLLSSIKIPTNFTKNSTGKSLIQNNQLIHVQDTFTFEDNFKIFPSKVIEVDEEQQSQNNNANSSDSLTQKLINEESQDEKDEDIHTTNTLVQRKPTQNSINHKNPLSFSRLNTFSQHENELEEDIVTINNMNNISNQLKQQNSHANIDIHANCDIYQNLAVQQNQYLQEKPKSDQIYNPQPFLESQQQWQINQNSTPLKASQNLQFLNPKEQENLQSIRKSAQKTRDSSAQKQQYTLSGSSQNLVDKHIDDIDSDIQNLAIKYSNRTLINKVFKSFKRSIQSTIIERREQENNDKCLMFYYRALKVKSFYSWMSYNITKQTYRKAIQKINYVKDIQSKIENE